MKHILYIGNQINSKSKSNVSTIDILSGLLRKEGFKVVSASNKVNIINRLLHMLFVCWKYRKTTDYVLIDTYSTLNFYYALFVSQLCRFIKLKYIPILHGGKLAGRLQYSPKLSKAIFKNAYKNVAPSGFIQSEFLQKGYQNIICIPNVIELEKYSFKNRKIIHPKLLWVRSFSKIYNPKLAVYILKALINDGINAELCMVGPDTDGSLKETKELAKKEGLNICFTGKLTKKEWIALSEDYNIFINTTNFDNMPVSVIEAMALGLPVISTNVGGMPFLIEHNKTGILVKPELTEPFVEAIKILFNNEELKDDLVKNARFQVTNYSWDIVKNMWVNLLD
ncbi:glycosyltransferase family 4 protein [Neotamlana laminarinivorans]|uniref:Glycosyltransferase family 4 protein n=1 Tax=Neotamlana laminarinivorans TaxID=2883124 RepID=A0A9X1I1H7_9FLAO|nr:glycosyltransferase family 4 protein [Tamlana laminarinivorans]MCB4799720.1 glycosyltransferase family 4 protein [Tamlana laminarinivorans]